MLAPLIEEALRLHRDGAPWSDCHNSHWTRDAVALKEFYQIQKLPPLLCTIHSIRQGWGPQPWIRDMRKPSDWQLRHRVGSALMDAYILQDWATLAEGLGKCF